jgi:hypothetical protein
MSASGWLGMVNLMTLFAFLNISVGGGDILSMGQSWTGRPE